MSAIQDYLYLQAAFGADRAALGAGRALMRRWSAAPRRGPEVQPAAQDQAAVGDDVVDLAGSTFSVRAGTWDAEIASETLSYIEQLRQRNLMRFANVIDIGGHIGSFSIHLARRAEITGKIYVLEPLKSNFKLICENIGANGFSDRIVPINAAASFRDGVCILNINPVNTGGNHLSISRSDHDEEVKTIDIALLFDNIEGPVDLLKIDCEGWEFPIFKRLANRLSKVRAIVGEFHRSIFSDPAHQRRFLERQGFKVEIFSDNRDLTAFFATNIGR